MNVQFPAQRRWASRLAHLAVVIVVLALAAATFVLSYTGVHSIALQAGVPTDAARIYPGIFDAALVIACAAALMLREGRWWARTYAWLSIIIVIAVIGAADAVHAMNVALPHRETAGVVAAAPWVLVLLGFSLWLTMLRQSRTPHTGQPLQQADTPQSAGTPQPTTPQPTAFELPRPEPTPVQPAPAEPAPAEPAPAEPADALPIPEDIDGPEGTPVSSEATGPEEAISPEETAALQETTVPEEAAPAEVAAEHEPTAAAERESASPPETPAEEAARAPELADEARDEMSHDEGHPLPGQATAEGETADGPSAPPHDYWDTDNTDGPKSQPAMRLHRVPAIPDEQEEPSLPFATVPRLRRVRSTPIPPEDNDEDQ